MLYKIKDRDTRYEQVDLALSFSFGNKTINRMSKRIVVIGAGIVGLSTALALQEKGHRVVIVAKWLPGDMHIEYTSPWAGK